MSRIIYGLPTIARVDDMMNSLVVRGGSPAENTFFVDNIDIDLMVQREANGILHHHRLDEIYPIPGPVRGEGRAAGAQE